jgi:hypothetical protein
MSQITIKTGPQKGKNAGSLADGRDKIFANIVTLLTIPTLK